MLCCLVTCLLWLLNIFRINGNISCESFFAQFSQIYYGTPIENDIWLIAFRRIGMREYQKSSSLSPSPSQPTREKKGWYDAFQLIFHGIGLIHLSLNRLLTVRAQRFPVRFCMTLMFNCRWFAMCILCLNQCHSHNYTRSLLPRLLLSSTPLSDSNHLSMTPRTSEYVIYSSGIWILGLDLTFAFYRNYKIISFWICVRLYLEHSTTTYLCK